MNLDNAKAQMRKGVLEYCIMLILSKNDAYASDIINMLKESEMIVVEGTLYPLLTRLKNSGLLVYHWKKSMRGLPENIIQLLNREGFFSELDFSWEELIQTVQSIFVQKHEISLKG